MIIMPTLVEKEGTIERYFDIPSRLFKDRIVMLTDEVSSDSANTIIAQLIYLDSQSNEDIDFIINSPGGDVIQGLAIYDCMNNLKSKVNTICYGLCASMGAFLLSSGTGVKKAGKSSRILLHSISTGTSGTIENIRIDYKDSEYLQNYLNIILSKNTNQKLSKIKKDCSRDYWMSADEALKYGVITEII